MEMREADPDDAPPEPEYRHGDTWTLYLTQGGNARLLGADEAPLTPTGCRDLGQSLMAAAAAIERYTMNV